MIEKEMGLEASTIVGAILKGHREKMKIPQVDIARKLKYKSHNFVSIIESGRSPIPANKFLAVLDAYQIPHRMVLPIMKMMHPQFWEIMMAGIDASKSLMRKKTKDIDAETDDIFLKWAEEYGALSQRQMKEFQEMIGD